MGDSGIKMVFCASWNLPNYERNDGSIALFLTVSVLVLFRAFTSLLRSVVTQAHSKGDFRAICLSLVGFILGKPPRMKGQTNKEGQL